MPVLLNCVVSSREPRFVEACLCCLRTLFYHPDVPVEVLYTDPALISHLLVSDILNTVLFNFPSASVRVNLEYIRAGELKFSKSF